PTSISVTVVAFGCLVIIPSLRTYFGDDIKSLKKVILLGTLIPLICYILWDMVIMGVVPLEGTPGLKLLLEASNTSSGLVAALTTILQKNHITLLAKFFTSICIATSFLSVSLSLSDFLSDGLQINKKGVGNLLVFSATFLPSLLIVLFYPNAFLQGLQYAGLWCFILMILLPPLMVWRGRYHRDFGEDKDNYRVRGGKFLLAVLLIFATLMIGFGIEGAV
ncbi:MAG: tryptophan/tyrosine permease, partial [Gammaproteobacteria bacterium]|nr:tryptophan/tyrosine permease [Gammaproteobacteria bacterium]